MEADHGSGPDRRSPRILLDSRSGLRGSGQARCVSDRGLSGAGGVAHALVFVCSGMEGHADDAHRSHPRRERSIRGSGSQHDDARDAEPVVQTRVELVSGCPISEVPRERSATTNRPDGSHQLCRTLAVGHPTATGDDHDRGDVDLYGLLLLDHGRHTRGARSEDQAQDDVGHGDASWEYQGDEVLTQDIVNNK